MCGLLQRNAQKRSSLIRGLLRQVHDPEPRSVRQLHHKACHVKCTGQRITRSTGLRRHQRSVLSQERVVEAGLARIGGPHQHHAWHSFGAWARMDHGPRPRSRRQRAQHTRLHFGTRDGSRIFFGKVQRRLAQGARIEQSLARAVQFS